MGIGRGPAAPPEATGVDGPLVLGICGPSWVGPTLDHHYYFIISVSMMQPILVTYS